MMYRLVFLIIQFLNVLYIVPFWSRPSPFVEANRSAYYQHAFKSFNPTSLSSSLFFSSKVFNKLSSLMNSKSDLNRNSQLSYTKLFDSVLKVKSSQSDISPSLKNVINKPRHHHLIPKHNTQECPIHDSYFAQNLSSLPSRLRPQSLSVHLSSPSTHSSSPYQCTNHRPTHLFESKPTQRTLTLSKQDKKQHRHGLYSLMSHRQHYSLPFPLNFKKPASIQTNLNHYLPSIVLPIFKSVSLPKKEDISIYFEKEPANLEEEYGMYVDKVGSNIAVNKGSHIHDSFKVTSDDETIDTEIPEM